MDTSVNLAQPGWTVIDVNGAEVGTVIENDGTEIKVKTGGLMSKVFTVPLTNVGDVETGRVELTVAKGDL
ncbi:MAG TPA: DUF2171 domain-containing protein [Candidatus Limnocylindrales bacterium]|nr:DUF2171 domain-containing protein [Candidatus Limnocylindrales bacterium]